MSPAAELALAWAGVMLAVAIGRGRYRVLRDQVARAPLEGLRLEGMRRAVVTTVAVAPPGLAARWEEDPAGAFQVAQRLYRVMVEVAAEFDAEVEAPRPEGLRCFLGRFRPHPDHRPAGLRLALRLRDRLAEEAAEMAGSPEEGAAVAPPPGIGVVTGDTFSAPFPLPGGELARTSYGKGPSGALRLALGAAPGEIRVDEVHPAADAGFAFEEGPDGARVLAGVAEPPEA